MNELKIIYYKKENEKIFKFEICENKFKFLCDKMLEKLNNFIHLKLNNSNLINKETNYKIYFGCLWDGNKIQDIIFREVCFKNSKYVPVLLNFISDDPETSSYKLFISNCEILFYDDYIPAKYIEEIVSILLKKYKKQIFILDANKIFIEDFLKKCNEELFPKFEKKNFEYYENYEESCSTNQSLQIENTNKKRDKKYNEFLITLNSPNNLFEKFTGRKANKNVPVKTSISFSQKQDNMKDYKQTFKISDQETLEDFETKSSFDYENFVYNKQLRNIIFTSGSTGKPKGVKLTYGNYNAAINSLNILLMNKKETKFIFVITNPLHHVNSTCFVEYCIRNRFELVLIHRYSREYWEILSQTIAYAVKNYGNMCSIIVPLVPKHFEYFFSMLKSGCFKNENQLINNLSNSCVNYFFGSSAVSYEFFKLFKKTLNGKVPRIRFGSTETCLQLCGTDLFMNDLSIEMAFEAGVKDINMKQLITRSNGYFIGRSVSPYSEIAIVKSIDSSSKDYLVSTKEYEIGYIICRGETIMESYIDEECAFINSNSENQVENMENIKKSERIFICNKHPWYIGLGDQGFWIRGRTENSNLYTVFISSEKKEVLIKEKSFETNFNNFHKCSSCSKEIIIDNIWVYWVSRSISIIKIGGVKYSSEEINSRLKEAIINVYNELVPRDLSTAVIGIKENENISEDDKVIFFYEPFKNSRLINQFFAEDLKRTNLHKSYYPFKVIEAVIPKTSKGTTDYSALKKQIISFNKLE